jgi:hypothetical protein
MPVPARIAVVAARQAFAHLDHREHAAHLDRAEGPLPSIIGSVFSGSGMRMPPIAPPLSPMTM